MEIKDIKIGDVLEHRTIAPMKPNIIVLGIRKSLGKDLIDGRYYNAVTGKFVKEEFNLIELTK